MSPDLKVVIDALFDADAMTDVMHEAAKRVGDDWHDTLKREAIAMPSVRAAIGVGIHATAEMLVETIEFGMRSVDEGRDGENLRTAALMLFKSIVNSSMPGSFPTTH